MEAIIFSLFAIVIKAFIYYFIAKAACKRAIRNHLPELKLHMKMLEKNGQINNEKNNYSL